MRLAFALFKYFPYGGLQRDCMRIAEECVRRGHAVDILTLQAQGQAPEGASLKVLPQHAAHNYKRYEQFAEQVRELVAAEQYRGVVGFNKMPYLDLYYAADPCYAAKALSRSWFYRHLGRTRSFLTAERAVFGPESSTHALLISPQEQQQFERLYGTDPKRLHMLPPGIQRDRLAPDNYEQLRADKRRELGLTTEQKMLLMVGSGFKTKGLDRSLRAIAALPQSLRQQVRLFVVGQDNIRPFQRMARSLGVADQFQFLGGRDDVAQLLFAADLLLHPAYRENTGTVLLEAVAATLPLLVTETCGYSFHITAAQCGVVLSEPFSQSQMNGRLLEMLTQPQRERWRTNARNYIEANDLFSMPQKAADWIEQVLSC